MISLTLLSNAFDQKLLPISKPIFFCSKEKSLHLFPLNGHAEPVKIVFGFLLIKLHNSKNDSYNYLRLKFLHFHRICSRWKKFYVYFK